MVLSPFRALVPRVRQPVARVVRWLLLVVSGWLLISLAHQTAVLGLAYLMRWIGSSAWAQSAVDLLPLDQVHARLMLESFAAIAPAGLSVGGPIADTANRIFPGLGLLPHIGPAGCRCLISERMEGDSSFTGVAFVMALGLVLVLVLSMILTHASRHRIRLIGGFLLLYGVLSVLALPWDLPQFEAMGLASAATKLFDITGETYATYRALIAVLLPLGVKLGIILAGIVAGQLLVTFWHRVVERVSFAAVRRRAMLGPLLAFRQIQHHRRVTIALALVLFLTGFRGSVSYVRMDAGEEQTGSQTMGIIVGSGPSTVKVERLAAGYQYLVNGKADVIRGMGYNPKDLDVTPEEAAARYHRDFKLMRESGVNTVIGWSEQAFDRTLLDVANQEGLGVVLPLELPVDVDYRDWAVRARLMQRVTAWVSEYKAHPALRMWGIGNEVLHDLIDTSPEQYDAFAAFLIDASDLIHTMDPAHHDMTLAIVSHLPHIIAYNIVGTADDLETVTKSEVIKYSASGFRDFTRLAASDPTMWRDVCLHNRHAILEMLSRFSEDLASLQRAIRWGDGDKLFETFTRARRVRREIIEAGQDSAAPNFGRDKR